MPKNWTMQVSNKGHVRPGESNMRPGGKDSNLAYWRAVEEVKESIDFLLLTVFLQLFLLTQTSTMAIHLFLLYQSHK